MVNLWQFMFQNRHLQTQNRHLQAQKWLLRVKNEHNEC